MRARISAVTAFLLLLWLGLCLNLIRVADADNANNNNNNNNNASTTNKDEENGKKKPQKQPLKPKSKNKTSKKSKKDKQKQPPVVLPPPRIRHDKALSRSQKWRRRLGLYHRNAEALLLESVPDESVYDPKRGFEMGVLSGLAYWEFHKRAPPHNCTGFGLIEKPYQSYYRAGFKRIMLGLIEESVPNAYTASWKRYREQRKLRKEKQKQLKLQMEQKNIANHGNGKRKTKNPQYIFEYSFYNWHEPTGVKGVSFHDTDVMISTTKSSPGLKHPDVLVISFAGTASVADAVTNVQTFEMANHSQFFEPPLEMESSRWKRWKDSLLWRTTNSAATNATNSNATKTQGSLHRGFLNAYSRVDRGSVLRLVNNDDKDKDEDEEDRASGAQQEQDSLTPTSTTTSSSPKTVKMPRMVGHFVAAATARSLRNSFRNAVKASASLPRTNKPPLLDSLDRKFGHCRMDAAATDEDRDDAGESARDSSDQNISTNATTTANSKSSKTNNNHNSQKEKPKTKKKKKRVVGCQFTDKAKGDNPNTFPPMRLSVILTELVQDALANGYTVHITGHSLGGALATVMLLDLLVNHNNYSNNNNKNNSKRSSAIGTAMEHNLYLWTYGAPQIADSLFWESLLGQEHNTRLRNFLAGGSQIGTTNRLSRRPFRHRQKFHRYVTFGDDGKMDAVSEVAKNTLAAHKTEIPASSSSSSSSSSVQPRSEERNNTNSDPESAHGTKTKQPQQQKKKPKRKTKEWAGVWHGKFAQSLGGVSRGGEVTHFFEAHYLWTPDQHQTQLEHEQEQRRRQQQQQESQQQDVEERFSTMQQQNCDGDTDDDACGGREEDTTATATATATAATTDTRSSMAAHSMRNYLMGISWESGPNNHPLVPDVPSEWLVYLEIASA